MNARVTNHMREEMRAMARDGFTSYEIAAHFDVSQTTASNYTRGLRPKTVPQADDARDQRMIAAVRAYDEGRAGLDLDAIARRFGFLDTKNLRQAARRAEQRFAERRAR